MINDQKPGIGVFSDVNQLSSTGRPPYLVPGATPKVPHTIIAHAKSLKTLVYM